MVASAPLSPEASGSLTPLLLPLPPSLVDPLAPPLLPLTAPGLSSPLAPPSLYCTSRSSSALHPAEAATSESPIHPTPSAAFQAERPPLEPIGAHEEYWIGAPAMPGI